MPVKSFLTSFIDYYHALNLLFKNNLWKYVFVPGISSLLLIAVLVITGFIYSTDISRFILDILYTNQNTNAFIEFLLNIFVALVIFILGLLIYRPLALILLSPFLSVLSEKTEKIISNKPGQNSAAGFWKDLYRSLQINIRFFLFSSMYSLVAIATGMLPVIGAIISAAFLFFIQAYYGGSGLADIILERRGMPVKERLQFIKNNRSLVLGSGSGFLLILLIPFLGWFFAPGLGTIAMTISLARDRK